MGDVQVAVAGVAQVGGGCALPYDGDSVVNDIRRGFDGS